MSSPVLPTVFVTGTAAGVRAVDAGPPTTGLSADLSMPCAWATLIDIKGDIKLFKSTVEINMYMRTFFMYI